MKSTPANDFFELLEALDRGEAPGSRGLAGKIVRYLASGGAGDAAALTPREDGVLRLVAEGHTNQDIATELSISVATVKFHMSNILDKLHLENRAQAVAFAHRHGLAGEPPSPPEEPAANSVVEPTT